MKNVKSIFLISLFFLFNLSCGNAQKKETKTLLDPGAFSVEMKKTAKKSIIDVRSPEEYSQGHIIGSKNINWNDSEFESLIQGIDKTIPIFIYCYAGGRSSAAAKKMANLGFKNIFELKGGMANWRTAGLPEIK